MSIWTRPCHRGNAEPEADQETAGAAGPCRLLFSTSFGSSNRHPPGARPESLPLFCQMNFKVPFTGHSHLSSCFVVLQKSYKLTKHQHT